MTIRHQLRPYQVRAVNAFYESVRRGNRSVVLCSPTGSGKTEIAMAIIEHALEKGRSVNFLVDRTSLKDQTARRFEAAGIPHGIEAGRDTVRTGLSVQIVMVQTAAAREIPLSSARLNIWDEGHVYNRHAIEEMRKSGTWLLMTATPFREGMADESSDVINVTTTDSLVTEGHLKPLRIYVPEKGITAGKKSSTGEYQDADIEEQTLDLVGDIHATWTQRSAEHFGELRPPKTLVFAQTIDASEAIAEEFRSRGFEFVTYHSKMADADKELAISKMRQGAIHGLVSVEALHRGFDVTDIQCIIDAHPWRRSVSQVLQGAGRGMRAHDGMDYCLYLDHARNILRHRETVFDFWRHGVAELLPLDKQAAKEDDPDRTDALCPECEALLFGPTCHACGWEKPAPAFTPAPSTGVKCVDGELVPLEPGDERQYVAKVGRTEYELPPPAHGWKQLCRLAQNAGKPEDRAQKWCQANYRKLYGEFRRARFYPHESYPDPVPELAAAVEHSMRLFVDRKKREHKAA